MKKREQRTTETTKNLDLWHSYGTASLIPGDGPLKIWENGEDCQLDLV